MSGPRCHGGVKYVTYGERGPRRIDGFEAPVCPNKPIPGRMLCEDCLALAMARMKPAGPEAGLRWPGVTTGTHVRARGTYAKRAPQ